MQTRDAVAHFGSRRKLAKALGISYQAVCNWGDTVPQLRAYELERLTANVLRVEDAPAPLPVDRPAQGDPGGESAA